MTPVQLGSGTMLADQHTVYQQQDSEGRQHQQIIDRNQQEIYYQQQQMYHQHQQLQMSYQQLQPIHREHQQQSTYHLPQPPPLQLKLEQHTQDKARTLWVGGLQHWMDEAYIYSCFSYAFLVSSISHIQNKLLGDSEGYCYVEFASQAAQQAVAERVLHRFNGFLTHTECQRFRLQWASSVDRQISFRPKVIPENSIGDGHLAPDGVLEHSLLQGKPQEGSEYSLWEGDLTLGFITEPGVLQENSKESPKYSTVEDSLAPGVTDSCNPKEAFSTPHPSAKQELVKVTIPACSTWAGGPGRHPCPWH